jgi:hypothetical protein
MQLEISGLPQRTFDHIMQAISMMILLQDDELEFIAASLENPAHYGDRDDLASAKAIADVVRGYKDNGK